MSRRSRSGDDQLKAAGITTPLRLAHLLAQCNAEAGGLTLTRESLMYKTESVLQGVFNNMKKTVPLFPGEVRMLLKQERDLGERFYGQPLPSELYKKKGMNGGTNPGNSEQGQRPRQRPRRRRLSVPRQRIDTDDRRQGAQGCGEQGRSRFLQSSRIGHGARARTQGDAVRVDQFQVQCDFADQDNLKKISRAINLGNPNSTGTPNGMKDREEGLKMAKKALGI